MTPLERAAKAAYERGREIHRAKYRYGGHAWEHLHEEDRQRYIACARAGLTALMKPDEETLKVGSAEIDGHPYGVITSMPLTKAVWQAMLKKVIE